MSNTTNFNLVKPAETDVYNIEEFNGNMDIIDAEMHKPPLTVNGIAPDSTTRDLTITEVPLAGNLSSDVAQLVTGEFIQRTSGGDASIEDGTAFLTSVKGNMIHTGEVAESINWNITGEGELSATFNRDTFVAYVNASGTYTLTYTSSWSADPALYGFTVTGTPVSGDTITIVYVKEDRGTITPANPTTFNSTGWNLFNKNAGYAKVVRYSDEYGFKLGGTYSLVEFATTVSGSRSAVSMEDGMFNVPSDGYVFVSGSDATTYIYATWSDWTEGYQGDFEAYSLDTIDLSEAMLSFPNGMFAVGVVRDEINLNTQTTIQRIERMAYTAENLAAVIASGVAYEADTNYIYAVLENPVVTSIDIDGEYTVSDHGLEYFNGTSVAVISESLYGENLKDKLRTDVLTISPQTLTSAQIDQVSRNIGLQYFRVRPSMYNKTVADLASDANSLASGVYLYMIGKTICESLIGDNDANGFALITVTGNGYAGYSATNGNETSCGFINLSTNAVTIHFSSANLDIKNQGSSMSDVTVATATDTNIASFSLTKGQWLIIATVDWTSNATGQRRIWLSATSGGGQLGISSTNFVAPSPDSNTRQQLPYLYIASADTTLYLVGRQTSGSSLTARPRIAYCQLR